MTKWRHHANKVLLLYTLFYISPVSTSAPFLHQPLPLPYKLYLICHLCLVVLFKYCPFNRFVLGCAFILPFFFSIQANNKCTIWVKFPTAVHGHNLTISLIPKEYSMVYYVSNWNKTQAQARRGLMISGPDSSLTVLGFPKPTAGAPKIWIHQSWFSRREKLYCPDVNIN